ncbi:Fe2OG dioxygenase domain-containing protein [Aphelenchoides besseyi]|nr:Fe2OG dioxygenase domain-containing protein [Aphelenchoides besseyi]KAI6209816.1 Fe2OG dioxygenase domain-containing protein [Aphelenchoides besseyi]
MTNEIAVEQTSTSTTENSKDAYSSPVSDAAKDSTFRRAFKFYKQRSAAVDLSGVVDLRVSNSAIGLKCVPIRTTLKLEGIPGLRPTDEWSLSTFDSRPGLFVLNNIFTQTGQLDWLQRSLLEFAEPPNVTNLTVDGSYSGSNVFLEKGEKLRWITMGNDYDWTAKTYADQPRSPMPSELVKLGAAVSEILELGKLDVDAAILNCYPEKATLSAHVDRSERSISRPLISLSFGQSAIYLTGGVDLDDPVDACLLQSGDVLVMHGDQRLVYHAVPRILRTTKFTDDRGVVNEKVLDYANRCRVNITLRQVD